MGIPLYFKTITQKYDDIISHRIKMANWYNNNLIRKSMTDIIIEPIRSNLIKRFDDIKKNALEIGEVFRNRLEKLKSKSGLVKLIRGKGLLNAMVINDSEDSSTAWDICISMKNNGLIAKPTHGNIIRFAPPLVINKDEINISCDIIEKSIIEYK